MKKPGLQKTTGLFDRLFPSEYREDPKILKSIYLWLLIGLLIRFIIMPFACHGDLLSTYHRSFLLLSEHDLQYLNPQEIIQAVNLLIFSPFIPVKDFLIWGGSTSILEQLWLSSMENYSVFRTLFLLKIPYILFDLATGFLLLYYFKSQISHGVSALKFRLFNPITLFTFYIFSRHDAIAIFFIVLCILLLKNNRLFYAALSLGIAIWSRNYAMLFVPVLLLLVKDDLKKISLVLIGALSPLIVFNLFMKLLVNRIPSSEFADSYFVEYFLAMKIDLVQMNQVIYIFFLLYFVLLFFILSLPLKNTEYTFTKYSLVILLIYYTTSTFSPQYFSWFIPFLTIIYAAKQDDLIITLHSIQITSFMLYIFIYGAAVSTWLFVSINPQAIISMQAPLDVLFEVFYREWPNIPFLNIFRTIFSASTIFMAFYLIKNDLGDFLCRTKN